MSTSLPKPFPQLILETVRKTRQTSQKQFREQLKLMRADMNRNWRPGIDPLFLFPPEIWEMVVENLKDINDLSNFATSHHLFSTIVNSTPQELLFVKALPVVFPYFGSNFATIAVTCGQVCKKWRAAVDHLAGIFHCVEQPIYSALDVLEKQPVPYFANKQMLQEQEFYGYPETGEDDLYITMEIKNHPFMSSLDIVFNEPTDYAGEFFLLDHYGHLLWELNLIFDSLYSARQMYIWIAEALQKCPNLKSFRIINDRIQRFRVAPENEEVDTELIIKVASTLEFLEITSKGPEFLALHPALLQKLSGKLKRVKLCQWNYKTAHNLPWPNLTDLEILEGTSKEVMPFLQRILAPKLYRLSIRLDSTCDFTQLFQVINSLGNLRNLGLDLTEDFHGDVLSVPLELLCVNRISRLTIAFRKNKVAHDIPVLFPLVRYLCWSYSPRAARLLTKFDDQDKKPERISYQFIQVYKNMYKSNVWTVLPQLEVLTADVKKAHGITFINSTERVPIDTLQFSRLKYVWESEKYALGVELHLTKVKESAKAELRRKIKEERNSLQNLSVETNGNSLGKDNSMSNNEKASTGDDISLFTKVFPYVLSWLTKHNLLALRQVCQNWKKLIEDEPLLTSKYRTNLQFTVPMTEKQIQDLYSFVEENKDQAFFARNLEIQIDEGREKVNGIKILLTRVGIYVHNLTLSSKIAHEITEIYQICAECMNLCPGLQAFTFNIPDIKEEENRTEYVALIHSPIHFSPRQLKSISLRGPVIYQEDRDNKLNTMLAHLNRMYHQNVLIVKQDRCKGGYFPSLNELYVRKYDSVSMRESMVMLRWPYAPVLEKLHLCVTGYEFSLHDLSLITKRYKLLKFLQLQFTDVCSGLNKNVIYYEPAKFLRVTELQIVMRNKYQVSLDFMVHFPWVQTLRIVYGCHANFLNEEYEELQQEHFILPVRRPEQDFIQLAKFFKDVSQGDHDKQKIYTSNVWKVLPKLKDLEVVFCLSSKTREKTVFYRKIW